MFVVLTMGSDDVVYFFVEVEEELILLHYLIELRILYFNLTHFRIL